MEEILEQAKKVAEEAEVFVVSSENTPVQFETNRLKHAQTHQSTMAALRLVRGGRIGYATATRLHDLHAIVDMAAETAEFGMKARFQFPSLAEYPQVHVFDQAAHDTPVDALVALGEQAIAAVRRHTPDLLCDARVGKVTSTFRIMNTRGGRASYRHTHFSISLWGTLVRGTDMLFVGDSQSSCHPILEASTIASEVKRQLEWAHELAHVSTASLPVIFTPPGVVSALMSPLMAGFNGKAVLEGASPVADRLGETAVHRGISIRDDPTIDFRPTSRPCDDEGTPSQRTPLIEQGIISGFLYDLQTAGLAGCRSTGNCGRGRGLPSPSPSAFVVDPGSVSFDHMVADIKEGLVVEEVMGATQGNVLGGEFSGNVLLGYKIEHGRIVGRVKNTMVSGNVYHLLKDIAAIGSDARWVGGVYTPSLCFPAVSVATK